MHPPNSMFLLGNIFLGVHEHALTPRVDANVVIIIITIKTIIKIEHKQISEDQIDVRIVKIITKETRLITIMIILIKEKTELMKILLMEYVVRIKIVNNKEKYASIK